MYKNYGTLPHSPDIAAQVCLCCTMTCALIIYIIFLLFNVGFHIVEIIIAFHYQHASCYESKHILSLSEWVFMNSFPSLIWLVVMIIAVGCIMRNAAHNNKEQLIGWSCFLTIGILLVVIYYIIVTILGIIELSYQFESCQQDTRIMNIFVIINIVLNLISFGTVCKCSVNIK